MYYITSVFRILELKYPSFATNWNRNYAAFLFVLVQYTHK